ncbi:MAG: hypothetical protein PHW95_00025 [Patescibacteria group bacterium]|nr:hypothetical protein [Patescibacteria group bacterium]
MKSPLNHHGAREEFGLPPEKIDAGHLVAHYVETTRPVVYREVHSDLNVLGTAQEFNVDPRTLPPAEMEAYLWKHYRQYHPEAMPPDDGILTEAVRILTTKGLF